MIRSAIIPIAMLAALPCVVHAQHPGPIVLSLQPYAETGLRTVTVRIGSERKPFFFDTGAGFTVIEPDETADAGCKPFGRMVGFRATGQRLAISRCGPVHLDVAGFDAVGEVGVLDLSPLLGGSAPPVGGLVGLESFEGHAVTLDLAEDRLIVETPTSLSRRIRSMHPIHLRLVRGAGGDLVPFIEARADTGTLWLEVDSGNNGPVFLAPHALTQLGLPGTDTTRIHTGLDVIGLGTVPVTAARREMIYDGQLDPAFLRQLVLTMDLRTGAGWARLVGGGRGASR